MIETDAMVEMLEMGKVALLPSFTPRKLACKLTRRWKGLAERGRIRRLELSGRPQRASAVGPSGGPIIEIAVDGDEVNFRMIALGDQSAGEGRRPSPQDALNGLRGGRNGSFEFH